MKALKLALLALGILALAVPMAGAQVGTWDSSFNVINLDTTGSASVEVTFYDESGSTLPVTCLRGAPSSCELDNPFTLAPGAKEEIYVPGIEQLPNGRYSVVISADRPIAAIASLAGNDLNNFYTASYTGLEDEGQVQMFMPGIQWNFYSWDSHLSIQNLTNAAQNITVQFLTEGSAAVCHTEGPHSTPAYASWHLDVGALDLSACDTGTDGFNGSAIISAAGPIAAVDNQTTDPADPFCPGCHFETAYNGFIEGATTLYVPDLYHKSFPVGHTGWDSSLNIQNVGGGDTVVTVTFQTSPAVAITDTLSPSEGWLIYLPSVAGLPTSPWDTFSAIITTDGGNVVAIVNTANPLNQAMTYNATASGGTTVAVPTVMRNYYGWDSSFVVQNLGNNDLVVHVSYSANANPGGPPYSGGAYDTGPIAPGDSLLIYQGDGDPNLSEPLPEGYTGGVILTIVSGNGPMAAVVNTTNGPGQMQGIPGPGDWTTSFNAINQ